MRRLTRFAKLAAGAALALPLLAAPLLSATPAAAEPYKIFLSMSYIGNDW